MGFGELPPQPRRAAGHDATRLPIGRAFDAGIEDGALKASVEFIPENTPEGGQFAEFGIPARARRLHCRDLGRIPADQADYTRDQSRGADDWLPGIDFEEQELVELSIVTVPANPEAPDGAGTGRGTAIAADTPPVSGEEITAFNEEQARSRARRRRVFQLALATAD